MEPGAAPRSKPLTRETLPDSRGFTSSQISLASASWSLDCPCATAESANNVLLINSGGASSCGSGIELRPKWVWIRFNSCSTPSNTSLGEALMGDDIKLLDRAYVKKPWYLPSTGPSSAS